MTISHQLQVMTQCISSDWALWKLCQQLGSHLGFTIHSSLSQMKCFSCFRYITFENSEQLILLSDHMNRLKSCKSLIFGISLILLFSVLLLFFCLIRADLVKKVIESRNAYLCSKDCIYKIYIAYAIFSCMCVCKIGLLLCEKDNRNVHFYL